MANKKNENKKPAEYFNISGMRIDRVRKIPGSSVITFSLLGKGIGFYNLKIVNGSRGEFIAMPATKGADGNYYAQYAVYFTDEDAARIIGVVKDKLPKEEAPAASASDF